MDSFTLIISIILILLFMQFEQNWLVFGVVMVGILSSRSKSTAFILLLAAAAVYFSGGLESDLWPVVVMGLVVLAFLFGTKKQEPQYPQEMDLGGMLGQEGMMQ